MSKPTLLCIASYEKGQPFLRQAAASGATVVLLTSDKLLDADWPRDALATILSMPDEAPPAQVLDILNRFARGHRIDRVVALDEFDLEAAALVREHMRLPGMGQSATYNFRDKLAMRTTARAAGIPVPDFCPVLHYDDLRAFMAATPAPWLLKPRTSASAIGIHKISDPERLWRTLDDLGENRANYLIEQFVPGEIFHVEGVTWNSEVLFEAPHKYGKPPMQTMHEGGVFTTRSLDRSDPDAQALGRIHGDLLRALGLRAGVTHSEFIRSAADGAFLFLETAARVGGAYIADVVEFATGLNPWVEWARLECAALFSSDYKLPVLRQGHAGSAICLARQADPDTSAFNDPEIVHRIHKHHHAGIVVASPSAERVRHLVDSYAVRFLEDFCAVLPAPDRPTS